MDAARKVKEEGESNDLIQRIIEDESFSLTKDEILSIIDPSKFTGRASGQVDDFIQEIVNPILECNRELLGETIEINV